MFVIPQRSGGICFSRRPTLRHALDQAGRHAQFAAQHRLARGHLAIVGLVVALGRGVRSRLIREFATFYVEIVRGNLMLVDEWLGREPRLRSVRPRAGTTILIRYDYPLPSVELCQAMFDLNGAFVVPGIAFGEEHSFRLGYACARDVLLGGLAAASAYLRTLES